MTGRGRLKPWEWWCIAFFALFGLFRLAYGSWFAGLESIGFAILYFFCCDAVGRTRPLLAL